MGLLKIKVDSQLKPVAEVRRFPGGWESDSHYLRSFLLCGFFADDDVGRRRRPDGSSSDR